MLAIGLYLIRDFLTEKEWKQVKSWDDLMKIWKSYSKEINKFTKDIDTLVPVELVIPSSDNEETVDLFHSALIDICSARNNNAQLPLEAAANKKGFYDGMKAQLPEDLSNRVEWKPNTWEDEDEDRPIKVRDLIALSWIPLNLLNLEKSLPIDIHVSAQNIYRNKGECSKQFDRLMEHNEVTKEIEAAKHVLIHKGVESAFKILGDLPELYDQIFEDFPNAYNHHNKRFRSNPIVKQYDPTGRDAARDSGKDISGYINSHPLTPFMRRKISAPNSSHPCTYPDGLIMPLVYGLQGIMTVKTGKVKWAVANPSDFVKKHLPAIAGSYMLVLDMGKWDPQKIAKNPSSHEFAVQLFKTAFQNSK